MNDERFALLVEKYVEGSISDDEARELLEAPSARLLDEVALASLLTRAHGAPADLAPKVQAALRGKTDKDAMVAGVLHLLPAEGPAKAGPARRGPGRLLLALAAAAAVAVVGFVLLRARPEPAKVAGSGSEESSQAIRRAVDYLRAAKLPGSTHQAPMPADDLVLLALRHAGVSDSDPFFKQLFDRASAAKLQRTYTVSLHAMLLRELDPAKHRDRLAACAKFLVDNQCMNGQWSYGVETPGPSPSLSGNNSCSIFAALGLRACADAGLPIPRETLDRAARWWRESRRPYPDVGEGEVAGWCYAREESPHRPYGSMTAGAVGALILEDALLGNDWRKDAAVQAGLRWLTKYFTVSENFGPVEELMAKELASDTPNLKTEVYYYLWALERVADLAGLQKLGTRDWHAEGAHELLAQQRSDGSWYGGAKRCQPVYDTCYAVLFLTRSTRALP